MAASAHSAMTKIRRAGLLVPGTDLRQIAYGLRSGISTGELHECGRAGLAGRPEDPHMAARPSPASGATRMRCRSIAGDDRVIGPRQWRRRRAAPVVAGILVVSAGIAGLAAAAGFVWPGGRPTPMPQQRQTSRPSTTVSPSTSVRPPQERTPQTVPVATPTAAATRTQPGRTSAKTSTGSYCLRWFDSTCTAYGPRPPNGPQYITDKKPPPIPTEDFRYNVPQTLSIPPTPTLDCDPEKPLPPACTQGATVLPSPGSPY